MGQEEQDEEIVPGKQGSVAQHQGRELPASTQGKASWNRAPPRCVRGHRLMAPVHTLP